MSWMTLAFGVMDRSKKFVDVGPILLNVDDISTVEPHRPFYMMDNIRYEQDLVLITMKNGRTKVITEPIDAVLSKIRQVVSRSTAPRSSPRIDPDSQV